MLYKWNINGKYEDLLTDGPAPCALATDGKTFANRLWQPDNPGPMNDTFGRCEPCPAKRNDAVVSKPVRHARKTAAPLIWLSPKSRKFVAANIPVAWVPNFRQKRGPLGGPIKNRFRVFLGVIRAKPTLKTKSLVGAQALPRTLIFSSPRSPVELNPSRKKTRFRGRKRVKH